MPYTLSDLCTDISNKNDHKNQTIKQLESQLANNRQDSPWWPMVNRLESNDFANPQEVFDALVHCAEAGAPPSLLVLMVEKAGKDFNYGYILYLMGESKYSPQYAAQMVAALKASGASFFVGIDDFYRCAMHNLARFYPEIAKTLISEMLTGKFACTQAEFFYTIYAATKYRFPVELVLQLVEKAEVDNSNPEQTFNKHFEIVQAGRILGSITNDDGEQEDVRECRTTLLHVFDYEHDEKLVSLVEALLAKGAKPFQSNYKNYGSGSAFNVLANKFKWQGLHKDVLIAVLNHMARNAGGANNLYSASTYLYVDKVPDVKMYDVMTDVENPYLYALAHYQYLDKRLKFKEGEKGFVRPVFQHAGLMMLVAYLTYKYGDLKNKESGGEYKTWESKVKDVVGLVKLMTDATPTPDKKKQKKLTRSLSGWRSNRYGVLREAFVEHVLSNQNDYQKHLAQLKIFYQTKFPDDSWDAQVIAKFKELGLGELLGVDKPEAAADTKADAGASSGSATAVMVTSAAPVVVVGNNQERKKQEKRAPGKKVAELMKQFEPS